MPEATEAEVPEPYLSLHKQSSRCREKLQASKFVGCFYCLLAFAPKSILEWIDDGQTAICPVCGVDAVIPLTEDEFHDGLLIEMHRHWFDQKVSLK